MRHSRLNVMLAWLIALLAVTPALAQEAGRYFPLDHRGPAGQAAHFNVMAKPSLYGFPQPVRISLPGEGNVTFFDGVAPQGVTVAAPGQARMPVGYVYRVKISDMPAYPGVELFPTVEVLDRLHPPSNMVDQFPIPVELTVEEIEAVLDDRMVTKVIYLERQDLPRAEFGRQPAGPTDLPPHRNLMQAATQLGRPMAILRLGGRIPAADEPVPAVPLQVTVTTPLAP
jgi:hypothetical protein